MSQSNTDGLGSLLDVGSVGVTLDIFEGPLDLLLHLVKSKEVSIDKVDLSEVVDQYCRLVAESEILNLDVLTEYAVVAANLISIKGKVLARIQTDFSLIPGDASDLDKDSFKSLEELRERIKAYELTKQRAGLLVETKQIGVDSFMRKPFKKVDYDHQPENAGILGSMYATFLSRLGGLDRRLNFEMEGISLTESISRALAFVVSKTKTSLRDIAMDLVSIVKKRGGSISNRSAVVSAFCSVLELMNKGLCNADVDGRDYFIRSSKVVEIEESKIDDSLVA